jgi:CO dehydrogenase/acetyl-CoA synthase beta subunit
MVPDILLPYTSASTTLLGTYSKQAAGLTDISAAYTMERQGPWYSRCVGLWQLQLQAPSLVTLNISQPAGQAMQVTLGDVTVHSMVPGPGTATGAASSSSQLMLLPGVYLMDVVARPAPGAANVSFSISMMAAQEQGWAGQEQGAISAAAWQSLVAG